MFESNGKTMDAARSFRARSDAQLAFHRQRREPPPRAHGLLRSMTCNVVDFAYLVVDVFNGRYDR